MSTTNRSKTFRGPTSQSVHLDGIPVNLSEIAAKTGLDQGYLSRIFAGKHIPGIINAKKIADAISFSLDRFASALEKQQVNTQTIIPKRLRKMMESAGVDKIPA